MTEEHDLPGLYALETERFRLQDLFFSRTDERGVIASGNVTFHEVSAYVWPELVGKPHKIIRHPDMPKGVFHLLWASIKSGEPVGGYVLNKAQDGAVYWVFAVMTPIEGGYLSVRLKPTSAHLDSVRPIYERLRMAEMNDGLSPEDSAKALMEAVSDLGFDDYRHFMSEALAEELDARCAGLHREKPKSLQALSLIMRRVREIEEDGSKVALLFARTEQIPYNMRLQAGRLEGSDGPISVISENHRQMSQTLTASVGNFQDAAALGAGPVREAAFGIATATLMTELIGQFVTEEGMSEEEKNKEINELEQLEQRYLRQARSAVSDVSLRVQQFSRMAKDMRRMLSGLEMTRIMCKIERSKAVGDTEGLDEIVNRLLIAERDIGTVMTKIDNSTRDIIDSSDRLLRSELQTTTLKEAQKLSA